MKKVAIIHTSSVSVVDLKSLFSEIIPNVELINIIDDSLLAEVIKNNDITPAVISRMCTYVKIAESLGADLILNQCSSVGESADIARKCVSTKFLKVDEPMAVRAVELGSKIGVIATVSSTVKPSCNLIKNTATMMNKEVTVTSYLVENALDILMKEKNIEKHNMLVLNEIKKAALVNDVVVLAQGSMITMLPYLNNFGKPVLTSPRMAVETIKRMLDERGGK